METNTSIFVYNGGSIPEDIDRDNITHVHVKEGVTSILYRAFEEWSSLTSVFIADGVKSIDVFAFKGCRKLISVRLPDSLETIGNQTFQNCEKLVRIRLPPNITSMGDYSFYGCLSLSNIEISSSAVTSIAEGTFLQCKSLSKVTIPTSLSTIGGWSFNSCQSIISIKLHGAIQQIDNHAFKSCTSLLSIQLPPSTTKIGNFAFASCRSLMIAYFPSIAIEDLSKVFGEEYYISNLILLTDRDDFIYRDNFRQGTPTLTLRAVQQCIHRLPNKNDDADHVTNTNNDNNNTSGDITSTTVTTATMTHQQQQLQALHHVLHDHHPDIAQNAQQSGLNLLHLLVYFPGDILQPLTILLDKCPLVTTEVDSTGRTPFHHTITSTQQNMDCRCYDLLASRTPDEVVPLAIHSLRLGAPWHEVYDIVKAKVNGLGVVDEESGLIPFMMVAVKDNEEDEEEEEDSRGSDLSMGLSAVYELLCMKPDVMNEYVDIRCNVDTSKMGACAIDNGDGIMMKRRRLK